MLLERWRTIVRDRPHQRALSDLPSRRDWTFEELDREARSLAQQPHGSIHHPAGLGPDFILGVLRAWYSGAVLCPLEAGQPPPGFPVPPSPICHLKTTSATTRGVPRGVGFTAQTLLADVDKILEAMGLSDSKPNLATISLAHSYGFSNLVLPLLCHAIPLILLGSSLPDSLRQALKVLPAVTLPAVPALWRAWLEAGVLNQQVRLAISAGAPLPLELEHRIHATTGLKVHNFYGASECGGIAYDASDLPRDEDTLIGTPMPGTLLEVDEVGCLTVRGPSVGHGYWPAPSPQLRPGCFQSSDLVRITAGAVHLQGRADDLIQVAGRKVTPEAIERVLALHPDIRQCLVFGIQARDRARHQTIVACVAADGPPTPDRFRSHLGHHLPAWQIPREWWFVDTLQTNARGKISRSQWRDRYQGRTGSAAPPPQA